MTRTLTAKISLAIAGSSSAAMGSYHFFLPSMLHWDRFVTKIPDSIQWALFSINFFFSYLLLAGVGTFSAWSPQQKYLERSKAAQERWRPCTKCANITAGATSLGLGV